MPLRPRSVRRPAPPLYNKVNEASCTEKCDDRSDISEPSGQNQEIDTDLSSHATMKTTRDASQNAFRLPCPILSGA